MAAAYAVFVGGLGLVALIGFLVAVRPQPKPAGREQSAVRIRESLRGAVGDHLAALTILLAGICASVLVSWPIARLARRFEPSVDLRFLRWEFHHWPVSGPWHDVMLKATAMGGLLEIKIVCVVAGVGFALLWRRGRWWIPLLAFPIVFVTDKYLQLLVRHLAERPKPFVSTMGSYPSGGCMRVLTVFGLIWFFVVLTWPRIDRGWRVVGWTVVAGLLFVEAYSRLFVYKHYVFDIVGGVVCGLIILLTCVSALSCVAKPGRPVTVARGLSRRPAPASVEAH